MIGGEGSNDLRVMTSLDYNKALFASILSPMATLVITMLLLAVVLLLLLLLAVICQLLIDGR